MNREQFLAKHDFPPTDRPSKFLVIASTPRSGSHMLGHSLYKTGKFGFPLEYAHPANLAEWKRILGTKDIFDSLREIQKRRTSGNGVFGIKIFHAHIKEFGGFSNVMSTFPEARYVLLNRKNALRQAISFSIASQTGVWIDEHEPIGRDPEYDYDHINQRLRKVIRDNSSWRYLLAANGCDYIEVDFESARKNISGVIRRIADYMSVEIDGEEIPGQPVTKRRRSRLNDDWERRFLADYNGEPLYKEKKPGRKDALKGRPGPESGTC